MTDNERESLIELLTLKNTRAAIARHWKYLSFLLGYMCVLGVATIIYPPLAAGIVIVACILAVLILMEMYSGP